MTDHLGPRPMNRRELLAGAGTGILAIYLVGCGGSSSKLPVTTAGTAPAVSGATTSADAVGTGVPGPPATGGKAGGKLLVVWQTEGNSNDPAIGYTGTSWDSICNLTYAPLYTYSEDNDPQPQCASDLPQVSADGLVYTIPLRDRRRLPQRPTGRGRRLPVRLGSRARPRRTRAGRRATSTRSRARKERYENGAKTVTGLAKVDDPHAPGHARAAGRHVPLRADAAVHGAGAEGGGREVRQGLPGARGRERPVQADELRPGRADDAVRQARRLPLARAAVPRPGRVPLGRRSRRADPGAPEGRGGRAPRRPRRHQPGEDAARSRASRTTSSTSRCSPSGG